MSQKRYTAELIKQHVEERLDELFAPWAAGRSETWAPDPATKLLIATGYWLKEELECRLVSDDDRRTQCFKYNRLSRSNDVFESAAECLNDVIDGTVEQNRRPHRRWG